MSDLEQRKIWSIDFCEDNLRNTADATQAVQRLKESLAEYSIVYNEQTCIHACRPCHAGALILRVDDQLITGDTTEEVINSVVALIAGERTRFAVE